MCAGLVTRRGVDPVLRALSRVCGRVPKIRVSILHSCWVFWCRRYLADGKHTCSGTYRFQTRFNSRNSPSRWPIGLFRNEKTFQKKKKSSWNNYILRF